MRGPDGGFPAVIFRFPLGMAGLSGDGASSKVGGET
jgi:hypothetical protein